jgi:hypothetical protein
VAAAGALGAAALAVAAACSGLPARATLALQVLVGSLVYAGVLLWLDPDMRSRALQSRSTRAAGP